MGIEAIGSIGSAMGSVASGIGKVSAGAAPAMASVGGLKGFGGLEGLAPAGLSALPDVGGIAGSLGEFKASVPLASFDKGPITGGFLEGFKPMSAADITTINTGGGVASAQLGEILFKAPSKPAVISQAEIVVAAAWEKSTLPLSKPTEVFPEVVLKQPAWDVFAPEAVPLKAPNIVEFPKPQIITLPILEPNTETAGKAMTKTSTENRISAAVAPAVLPQAVLQEQEVEEIEEEKMEKQKLEERLEEEEEIERQVYLEDEDASAQRKIEIRAAVVKARAEADRLGLDKIAGWLVSKFLPGEHAGNRSQVVRKTGPDGSYQETVEAIGGAGEFESGEKAVERFDGIVAEKKPVKLGKNGNPVGNKDVARVFMHWLVKPIQATEEVVKRVVKKKAPPAQQSTASAVATEKKIIMTEPNLEQLSPALAGVFQKAA